VILSGALLIFAQPLKKKVSVTYVFVPPYATGSCSASAHCFNPLGSGRIVTWAHTTRTRHDIRDILPPFRQRFGCPLLDRDNIERRLRAGACLHGVDSTSRARPVLPQRMRLALSWRPVGSIRFIIWYTKLVPKGALIMTICVMTPGYL
jgi:hypothetical protein